MPTYEYQCTQCGAGCEFFQKMSDAPKTTCPHCHAEALQKQVSAPQFQLKGGGWYVTDFRDQGKKKPESKKTDSDQSTPAETSSCASEKPCGKEGAPCSTEKTTTPKKEEE